MLPSNSITGFSSVSNPGSSNRGEQEIWFDAIDHVVMEDAWFDACESHQASPADAGEAADSWVPFTEDCRRGVQQLVRTLGEYGESKMLSACLAKILPGAPTSLVIAANSLYTLITEQRNIDTAALHALVLASWCLPDDINIVSRLAAFIRDTVTDWTNETFLQQFLGEGENHASAGLFTALAVTAIVVGRWMKDEGAPQRGLLKVPAFMANIFIRASHYWNALGNMARSFRPGGEMPGNTEPSRRVPAFEVDTLVEMTGDVCDAVVPCSSSAPRLTVFSSNSTAIRGAYTRGMVQSKPASAFGESHRLPVPERGHSLVVDKLRQESGLSDLLYCTTLKTEISQQADGEPVTTTYFNTKCDATAYPEPLIKAAESTLAYPDKPETQVLSAATSRSGADALLPLVMTAAAVPMATSYMQALKSKSVMAAGAVAGLTGLTVGGKLLWDTLFTHNPQGKPVNRTDDIEAPEDSFGHHVLHLDGPGNFHKSSLQRANHRVKKLLCSEGVLQKKGEVSKEKRLYAASVYLFYGKNKDILKENNIKLLAQKIVSASGMYGGKEKEKLSSEQAKSVVRYWVFQNIIGTTPEKYIESKMKLDISRRYTVDDIHRLLSVDTLPTGSGFHPDRLSLYENTFLSIMWKSFLMEEMPFLVFSDEWVKTMPLNDYDFANLYSGSRFLKNTRVKDFTPGEAILTGKALWDLAISEGITENNSGYYLAPALLFNAANLSGGGKKEQVSDVEVINEYLQYRQEVSEVQKDIKEKYNKYLSAAKKWLSKGKLADYIISQCPVLSPGLADLADAVRSAEQKREKAELYAQQKYLNGMGKPCESAPESLNSEYHRLTADLSDSFRRIDKYLILSAIITLPEDEINFIQSSDATLHPATAYVQMMQPGSIFVTHKHFVERTDLFAVKQEGRERIYALKAEKNNDNSYKLIRVDRDVKQYLSSGVLGGDFDDYKITWDKIEDSDDITSFGVKIMEPALSGNGSHINTITDSLSKKHRDDLYNALYGAGNDKSDIQKIWNAVKHFIPFYDCVEGIVNSNPQQAIPSCLLDAVAFIPVFGKAASLSGKFGMGLARGLRSGALIVGRKGIKTAGKNLLRKVNLPTTAELALLGKDALRAADPGFALIGGISSKFGNKIVKPLFADKETAGLAKRIISSSESGLFMQPPLIDPVMVTLPRTHLQVPAIKLGIKKGRDTYICINMETGEKFGKYFFRDVKGGMLEIKKNYGVYGGMNVGKIIPTDLQESFEEFQRYIKDFMAGQCTMSAVRPRRQVNCRPLSLSVQTLNRVLEYASVNELSVLARDPLFRDSVFRTVNQAARAHPEVADRLIVSIANAAEKNGDTNLLSTIAIGKVDTDIQRALVRYQKKFVKTTEMVIESPRVLGTHDFDGYNPNFNIPSQGVHASYTAIDTDNFIRRLNIVMHGVPGGVFLNGNTRLNADELYQSLYEYGILEQDFTEIRMLVCSSADATQNGGISVAERLSQLTGKPVEGYKGTMTMYETFNIGDISIPSVNMVNDAYMQGGPYGATEFMQNNRDYISIGVHPFPAVPNNPETFYPF